MSNNELLLKNKKKVYSFRTKENFTIEDRNYLVRLILEQDLLITLTALDDILEKLEMTV